MTFNLKDFKAMLGLCDHLGSNVMLRFEGPGLPLVVEPHFPTLPGQVGALGGRAGRRAGRGRRGGAGMLCAVCPCMRKAIRRRATCGSASTFPCQWHPSVR